MVPEGLPGEATISPSSAWPSKIGGARLVAGRFAGGQPHRLQVERLEDLAVARIARLAQTHALAGIEQRGEGQEERARRARGDDHPPGVEIDPVPAPIEISDALR